MPTFKKLNDSILEIRFANSYELCHNTYLFSHHYEDAEWQGKVFTRAELDEYYEKTHDDAHWWKKRWAGSNIPDYAFDRFLAGDFLNLSDFERDLVDRVRVMKKPYYVIMTSYDAMYCREHEIAHAMWHTNKEYRDKAQSWIESWRAAGLLVEAEKALVKVGYSESVMLDELHVFCGIYFDHYFKPLCVEVTPGITKDLVGLFEAHKL